MTNILILLLYLFLYVIATSNLKAAIFLYILFLPLRNLIDIHILGLFTPSVIFSFILFFYLFRKGYVHNLGKYIEDQNLKRLSIFIIIFIISAFLLEIRERIVLGDYRGVELTTLWTFNRAITSFIQIINLLVLVNVCFLNHRYRTAAYKAMVMSSIVVVSSLYFAPFLASIGINVRDVFEYDASGLQELGRVSGLYQGGDTNSVSIFLNLIIAIILINHVILRKKLTIISLSIVVLLATGVLITGSRMGFVALVFVSSYYVLVLSMKTYHLTVKTVTNIFLFAIAVIGVAYLATQHERFAMVFERIANQGLTDEVVTTGHRYIRWIGFIEHTMSKTSWFLWGSDEVYFAFTVGNYRDPHNLLVRTFYINGFIILYLFVWSYIKLLISLKKSKMIYFAAPLFLVIAISMLIISSYNNLNILVLYTGIIIHLHPKRNLDATKKKWINKYFLQSNRKFSKMT